MIRAREISFEFVHFVPDDAVEGVLYVSTAFATAVHKCCCGCGEEVVTPLSPVDWTVTYDGETVTLDPSIGNWSLPCRSHYWIQRNRVVWAPEWTQERVSAERGRQRAEKEAYVGTPQNQGRQVQNDPRSLADVVVAKIKRILRRWISGLR